MVTVFLAVFNCTANKITFFFSSIWQVPLGTYPEQRFDEWAPEEMIKKFQDELASLAEDIMIRNERLEIPYTYLNPDLLESSITE